MPAIPPLPAPLEEKGFALRFSAERDIPEILIAHQDDPHLYARLGLERAPSGAELGQELERVEAERAAGSRATLTLVQPPLDACRGQVYVHSIDWRHARGSLGIWVAPQARGRGLARRALRLVAGWLFRSVGLERVALLTEPDNEPMLRAALAAGFVREGRLRSYGREGGRRIDLVLLSLLPEDLAPPGGGQAVAFSSEREEGLA